MTEDREASRERAEGKREAAEVIRESSERLSDDSRTQGEDKRVVAESKRVRGERGRADALRYAIVGYVILLVFVFIGGVVLERQAQKARDLAQAVVTANRDGCERVNTLRVNQARFLADDLRQSVRILRGPLNGLTPFRGEIERRVSRRRVSLRLLRESVLDNPVPGKPYRVNCEAAEP